MIESHGGISDDSAVGQFGQLCSTSAAMAHGRRPMASHATRNVPRTRRPHVTLPRRIAAKAFKSQPQFSLCHIDTVPSVSFRSYREYYLLHRIANIAPGQCHSSQYRQFLRPMASTYTVRCIGRAIRMKDRVASRKSCHESSKSCSGALSFKGSPCPYRWRNPPPTPGRISLRSAAPLVTNFRTRVTHRRKVGRSNST